jgi:rfaE bifunctional protein kinase chain/domain/rfaE bifunctional protein nucleotidyltransferase chain/domain
VTTAQERTAAVGTAATPDLPLLLRHLAPTVVVVGDLMLDGWWIGRTERMSREAPAPVVELTERRHAPGGAANTAMNLAALGARVRLVGLIGDDDAGRTLRHLLTDGGVDVSGVQVDPAIRTVTKNRIVSGDQVLVRLDDVDCGEPGPETRQALVATIRAACADAEAMLVCDYGAGVLLPAVSAAFADLARPPLFVVDAHDPLPWAELRPDVVTPNAAEAFRLLGRAPSTRSRLDVVLDAADLLRERTGSEIVVVTLDREGTLLLGPDGRRHRTLADPTTERQATGAGDTFVAALTLARLAGADWPIAAELAQSAADVVVHRFGTSVCSTDDLVEQLGRLAGALWDEESLVRRIAADRAAGRRIVLTNGCFDVLHRGHTTYLAQAAQLGDVLVVALNSDDSVRRLKGPERPINPAADRAGVIAALSCVTYVTVFDTDTPIPLLRRLQPDVYVKGGDYTPEMLPEAEVVHAYGGEVRIVDYVPAHSTTDLVGRIRASAQTRAPEGA